MNNSQSTTLQNISQERYVAALAKIITIAILGITIIFVNGVFVYTFFRSSIFYNDARYILYIHLVLNDTVMVFITGILAELAYAFVKVPVPFCIVLLLIASTTHKNTPLTLAGMAVERYIAVCKPLHHAQICTVRRTYILIALIWAVGMIPGWSDFFLLAILEPFSITSNNSFCNSVFLYTTPHHDIQTKVMNNLYSSVVFLILIFTYCKILVAARRATTEKSSAKKAQNTILLHGLQLLLCMLSYITPVIDKLYALLPLEEKKNVLFLNYILTNILPRLLSPMIYGVRDKHFYSHIMKIFSCKFFSLRVKPIKKVTDLFSYFK